MLKEFKEHIEADFPYLNGKKLLLACSGGVDSVVLFHLMKQLDFELGLAHCNFSLRGSESDEDETFVSNLAERFEVPFYSETFDTIQHASTTGASVQMAARELRYAWFEEIRADFGYDYILTAHHAGDSVETFFINLYRSSGLKGLAGIPALNNKVVRPLLPFNRDLILDYAKTNDLYWREDSSNADTKYLRNQIRKELLPVMKQIDESFINAFLKTQSHLRDSVRLIDDYLVLIKQLLITETEQGLRIDTEKLGELPNSMPLLYELLAPYGFSSRPDLESIVNAQSGKYLMADDYRLVKDRNCLILASTEEEMAGGIDITESTEEITEPVHLKIGRADAFEVTNAHTVFVDKAKLSFPLQLRRWREGDWFHPFGMKGRKKLSKYFKDEKLSLVAKENCWVLCSGNDILWVVGLRLDDRFKVTRDTEEILRLDYLSN